MTRMLFSFPLSSNKYLVASSVLALSTSFRLSSSFLSAEDFNFIPRATTSKQTQACYTDLKFLLNTSKKNSCRHAMLYYLVWADADFCKQRVEWTCRCRMDTGRMEQSSRSRRKLWRRRQVLSFGRSITIVPFDRYRSFIRIFSILSSLEIT